MLLPNGARALVIGCALLFGCRPAIPPALAQVEDAAEDAYDLATGAMTSGARAKAAQRAQAAVRAWQQLAPILRADGAAECELSLIEERIAALERAEAEGGLDLARAANAVAGEVAELLRRLPSLKDAAASKLFSQARLIDLDVLGREIVLDADAAEWRAADAAFSQLGRDWQRLRPCSIAADPEGAAGFDACLAQLSRPLAARDGQSVILAAKACLEQIDVIEKVLAP